MVEPLLEIRDVSKTYRGKRTLTEIVTRQPERRLAALRGVSLTLPPNGSIGIVGESGSGKSTLARCIVRLAVPDEGKIEFRGENVLAQDRRALADFRRRVQMIYQDPFSSLNPRMRIRDAVAEPALVHEFVDKQGADVLVADLLKQVGLGAHLGSRRPAALSGGQRQRAAIARALAARPEVLIADEAVSALDVSIQAQILNLFADLREQLGLALIFISHQLSVVAHIADTVAVMYMGRVVETGPTEQIFSEPAHPYTRALLAAQPRVDRIGHRRSVAVTGQAPSPFDVPTGCAFRTRCPYAIDLCAQVDPELADVSEARAAACHVLPGLIGLGKKAATEEPTATRTRCEPDSMPSLPPTVPHV